MSKLVSQASTDAVPASSPDLARVAIDLIIPARNERHNIAGLFAALPMAMLRRVIVVDNGSTDDTAELARQGGAIVVHEPQRGYGAACLAGLAQLARGASDSPAEGGSAVHPPLSPPLSPPLPPPDIVAFLDADLSDDPGVLPRLCEPIAAGRADLVIAARVALAEPGSLTPTQRCGNALACRLIRLLTGKRYRDLGPMRAIRYDSLLALDMRDRTWGWTVEMQFKAATHGLRTLEIDAPYRRRHAGSSKISGSIVGSTRAGWRILATIAKLWRERAGHA